MKHFLLVSICLISHFSFSMEPNQTPIPNETLENKVVRIKDTLENIHRRNEKRIKEFKELREPLSKSGNPEALALSYRLMRYANSLENDNQMLSLAQEALVPVQAYVQPAQLDLQILASAAQAKAQLAPAAPKPTWDFRNGLSRNSVKDTSSEPS